MAKILTIPGIGGSGIEHWHTHWEEELENIQRVEQADWDNPELQLWADTLNSYVENSNEKIILVAHSLACSLVAYWASNYETNTIKAALLVSPADVNSADHTPEEVRNFAPISTETLPFKSIVVASDNDPYVAIDRAKYFAKSWGSHFINYGSHGHINADSGLGSWQDGKDLVAQFDKNR